MDKPSKKNISCLHGLSPERKFAIIFLLAIILGPLALFSLMQDRVPEDCKSDSKIRHRMFAILTAASRFARKHGMNYPATRNELIQSFESLNRFAIDDPFLDSSVTEWLEFLTVSKVTDVEKSARQVMKPSKVIYVGDCKIICVKRS